MNQTLPVRPERPEFAVTLALLSTSTVLASGDAAHDRLASMESALAWFESLPADLRKERERDLKPDVAGLDQLRQFRESLRSAFRADHTGAQTADGLASFTSNVALRWTPTGLEAVSQDVGWRRIQAEVDIELLLAQASGRLRRLKTCAYELCGFPFVDSSRNLSRVWHDTAKCGNVVNLRASRARRNQA